MIAPVPWPQCDLDHLHKAYRSGVLYREIGNTMPSGPRTKNSVIGMANRLGLKHKDRTSDAPLPIALPMALPRASLHLHRASGTCLYPVGDPRSADFRYCGETVRDGGSWCSDCRVIVFRPALESVEA
tara:strand:+ start:2399 stop:2782 length:384 start_codon:yes stop_codon:yes gene_type:complete